MFDQDLLLEFFEGKDKDAGTYSTWFQRLFLKISVFQIWTWIGNYTISPQGGNGHGSLALRKLHRTTKQQRKDHDKKLTDRNLSLPREGILLLGWIRTGKNDAGVEVSATGVLKAKVRDVGT